MQRFRMTARTMGRFAEFNTVIGAFYPSSGFGIGDAPKNTKRRASLTIQRVSASGCAGTVELREVRFRLPRNANLAKFPSGRLVAEATECS